MTTGGAVDPTVGSALVRLGYDRDFAGLPELRLHGLGDGDAADLLGSVVAGRSDPDERSLNLVVAVEDLGDRAVLEHGAKGARQ